MAQYLIRCAEIYDYDNVELIMKQVQQLHVNWRPDIYKPTATVYPIEYFDHLVVKKECRGQGIGTQLLNRMKEKVQAEHLDGLELQVNACNTAARRMYEKFGFTEKSINLELL